MASVAQQWLHLQGTTRRALFTDIDNTLVRADNTLLDATKKVRLITAEAHMPLILITGLSIAEVLARIDVGNIPLPEIICSSVGTHIWLRQHNGSWQEDKAYAQKVASVGFSASKVLQRANNFMLTYPSFYLSLQPNGFEPNKVSLHFMADTQQAQILRLKAEAYFAPFAAVTCEEINFNRDLVPGVKWQKYCLDILPMTKSDALSHIIQTHTITGGFKAGDSGNDIDMLLNDDVLVPILVGGYTTEAKRALAEGATQLKDSFHLLKDGRIAYIETDSYRAAQSLLNAIDAIATAGTLA